MDCSTLPLAYDLELYEGQEDSCQYSWSFGIDDITVKLASVDKINKNANIVMYRRGLIISESGPPSTG